jgi:hypothetical protein
MVDTSHVDREQQCQFFSMLLASCHMPAAVDTETLQQLDKATAECVLHEREAVNKFSFCQHNTLDHIPTVICTDKSKFYNFTQNTDA